MLIAKKLTVAILIFAINAGVCGYLSTSTHINKNKIIYLHEQKIRSIEESKLNKFIQENNVIIIFYEDWCGYCRRMTPIFEELVTKMNDIIFIKIKRSLYKNIFDTFGLTTVPAMVFFKNGKLIHTQRQSVTKNELIKLIKQFFSSPTKKNNT